MPNTQLASSTAVPLWTVADITALVLAGGRGVRMGGVDKGLQPLNGVPMAQHALRRMANQQGGALAGAIVNANRNPDVYRTLGEEAFGARRVKVVPDRDTEFPGPLAGFQVGLDVCATPLMLTVPCDSPFFPLDLAQRLLQALLSADAEVAVVQAPAGGHNGCTSLRSQPVFCLMRTAVAPSLHAFLAGGGRKVDTWIAGLRHVQVPFDAPGDDPRAFANANTLAELHQLEM
jgi:molybdenum cofactor guanylyltransferase